MKRRIYYVIPDIHNKRFSFRALYHSIRDRKFKHYLRHNLLVSHKPVGGIKVIYQHVLLLKDLGYEAELIRMGSYEGNFFGYNISAKQFCPSTTKVGRNDIVVIPEYVPYLKDLFPNAIKICFVQNWVPIYKGFKQEDHGKGYVELGFDYVMCCSQFLVDRLHLDAPERIVLINNFIDLSKFTLVSSKRTYGTVLGLPRKHPDDLKKILKKAGQTKNCTLVDGASESSIIEEYQRADVFIATGYPEGFGLPPIEAMACGAVVVGFTGGGASEYMIHEQTALVANDGDCEQVAEYLTEVLTNQRLKETLRQNGLKMAAKYDMQRTKKQLSEFYASIAVLS